MLCHSHSIVIIVAESHIWPWKGFHQAYPLITDTHVHTHTHTLLLDHAAGSNPFRADYLPLHQDYDQTLNQSKVLYGNMQLNNAD